MSSQHFQLLYSLFKHYAMRKTAKAQLAKVLMSNVQPSERNSQIYHVLDGGALCSQS